LIVKGYGSELDVMDTLTPSGYYRQEAGDDRHPINRFYKNDWGIGLYRHRHLVFDENSTWSSRVERGSVAHTHLAYLCVDFNDSGPAREIGDQGPLACLNGSQTPPFRKHRIHDRVSINDIAKRVEVIEQRQQIIDHEVDALHNRRDRFYILVADRYKMGKDVRVVMPRGAAS
jgi:hypothetical protein